MCTILSLYKTTQIKIKSWIPQLYLLQAWCKHTAELVERPLSGTLSIVAFVCFCYICYMETWGRLFQWPCSPQIKMANGNFTVELLTLWSVHELNVFVRKTTGDLGMVSLNKHVEQISFRQCLTFCKLRQLKRWQPHFQPFPTYGG